MLRFLFLYGFVCPPGCYCFQNITLDGGGRQATAFIPTSYNSSNPAPLLILIHGLADSGQFICNYFQILNPASQRGMVLVVPEGVKDISGQKYWNIPDVCCDFYGANVDDFAYLVGLIDEISGRFSIDPKRVYVAGHSNGGFMALALACRHADRFAAVFDLAGALPSHPCACNASSPVSVLHIHGSSDPWILYAGGVLESNYTGAVETGAVWARADGCSSDAPVPGTPFDLGPNHVAPYEFGGCPAGVSVTLWTLQGGGHNPVLPAAFAGLALDFLLAHPKVQQPAPGHGSRRCHAAVTPLSRRRHAAVTPLSRRCQAVTALCRTERMRADVDASTAAPPSWRRAPPETQHLSRRIVAAARVARNPPPPSPIHPICGRPTPARPDAPCQASRRRASCRRRPCCARWGATPPAPAS